MSNGKQTGPSAPAEEANVPKSESLTRLIPVATLQAMQDRFARLGQFSICICDADGNPLTETTWGSRYSALIGLSPGGQPIWHEGLRTVARSADPTAPHVILERMTLYGVPVIHDKTTLAMIVVGTRPIDVPGREVVRHMANQFGADPDELIKAVDFEYAWTGGTPEAIHQFAQVLSETLATLYDQAVRINRQLADLRIVHGMAELLAGSSRVQDILDITVTRVAEVMNAKASAIRLLDERTGELIIKARHNLSEDYLRKGPVTLTDNAIDTAAFRGETVYIQDAPTDPRIRYPENARREGIKSGLCVPMTFRGQTIGVLRVYTIVTRRFSESEQQLMRSLAGQAAAAVISSRLFESLAREVRDKHQIESAQLIQRRMLPSRAPVHDALDFGRIYEPSLYLSGDFYDFVDCQNDALGVCIADVVGKGLPAALLMASVRSSMRAHAAPAETVADLISRTNRDMCRDTMIGEFATMFFGLFSRDGRRLTYCNAGHVPPLLCRGNQVTSLDAGGGLIGIDAQDHYDEVTIELQSGDTIVMMTDGITEAFDFQDNAYGTQRIIDSIVRHADLSATQLAGQLLWDVRRFVGLAEQSDDITIVTVKVRPA